MEKIINCHNQYGKNDNCEIFYDILYFLTQPNQPSYDLLNKINSIG